MNSKQFTTLIKTLLNVDLNILISKRSFFVIETNKLTHNEFINIERVCYQHSLRFEKNGNNGYAIYTK